MTINATAPILLLLYELVAEERGVDASALGGTVQNDLLKEYAARGTYIYPPKPSMRLITDMFAYCGERIPNWNTISISGYHMREAGSTAAQEIAFTLANGIAYVQAAIDAGLAVDDFAPRLSFFFACHMHFFEEVAKFRAARRLWARIMIERFGAKDPRSRCCGSTRRRAARRSPPSSRENNIVRTALEAMSAVLGGTQSLHTNSFDEALALPTEQQREDRAADAAGDRRTRPAWRTWRPARGFVLRGGADRRARGRGDGVHPARGRPGRRRRRDRGGLLPGRDPRGRVPDPAGDRDRRACRRRREPVPGRGGAPARAAADRRGGGRGAGGAVAGAPRVAGPGRGGRGAEGRGGDGARCRQPAPADEARRCGPARRSARCPTSSAACSASTTPATEPASTTPFTTATRPATPRTAPTTRVRPVRRHAGIAIARHARPTSTSMIAVRVVIADGPG